MDLIGDKPTKIHLSGDMIKAKAFIGAAQSQLELLKNQLSLQNRDQGIRRVWLNTDTHVECRKIFNLQECFIWVRSVRKKFSEGIIWQPILVISNQSETEAIAWDLYTDTIIGEKTSLEDLYTFLSGGALPVPPIKDPAADETLCSPLVQVLPTHSGTDLLPTEYSSRFPSYIYGPGSPYNTIVSPINPEKGQPYFIIDERFVGTSGVPVAGSTVVFQTEESSDEIFVLSSDWPSMNSAYISGHEIGSIDAIWTITIFAKSGDQFSVKNNTTGEVVVGEFNVGSTFYDPESLGASYIEIEGENKCGAYLWYLYSQQIGAQNGSDIFQDRFETLSETSWPEPLDSILTRECTFFNPVFGVDLHDDGPGSNAYRTQLLAATELFTDTWNATEEYSIGDSTLDRMMHGYALAEMTHSGDDVGKIFSCEVVMDWHTFCSDYEGSVSEGFCADYEKKFIHDPHIYFKSSDNRNTLSDLLLLVNEQRVLAELEELVVNRNLQVAANKHAQWMAENLTMSHTGADGSLPQDRIKDENYLLNNIETYQEYELGENIGALKLDIYTYSDLVSTWMSSPGHRDNILNDTFTETGLAGAIGSDGKTYICQTFGYRQDVWPGFSSFEPTKLKNYISENFLFSSDINRTPKTYLVLRGIK